MHTYDREYTLEEDLELEKLEREVEELLRSSHKTNELSLHQASDEMPVQGSKRWNQVNEIIEDIFTSFMERFPLLVFLIFFCVPYVAPIVFTIYVVSLINDSSNHKLKD